MQQQAQRDEEKLQRMLPAPDTRASDEQALAARLAQQAVQLLAASKEACCQVGVSVAWWHALWHLSGTMSMQSGVMHQVCLATTTHACCLRILRLRWHSRDSCRSQKQQMWLKSRLLAKLPCKSDTDCIVLLPRRTAGSTRPAAARAAACRGAAGAAAAGAVRGGSSQGGCSCCQEEALGKGRGPF